MASIADLARMRFPMFGVGGIKQPGFNNDLSLPGVGGQPGAGVPGVGTDLGGGAAPVVGAAGGAYSADTFAMPPPVGAPTTNANTGIVPPATPNPGVPGRGTNWGPTTDPAPQAAGPGWTPGNSGGGSEWEKYATANLNVPLHAEGNAGRGYMPDPITGRMVPREMVEGQGGVRDRGLARLDSIANGSAFSNARDDGTVRNMQGHMGRGGPAIRQAQQQQQAAMKAQWVREGKNPAEEMAKYNAQQKSNYAQTLLANGDPNAYAGYAVSNMDPTQWDPSSYGAIEKILNEQTQGAQNWMAQMAQNDPSMQFQGPNPYQQTIEKNKALMQQLQTLKANGGYPR